MLRKRNKKSVFIQFGVTEIDQCGNHY